MWAFETPFSLLLTIHKHFMKGANISFALGMVNERHHKETPQISILDTGLIFQQWTVLLSRIVSEHLYLKTWRQPGLTNDSTANITRQIHINQSQLWFLSILQRESLIEACLPLFFYLAEWAVVKTRWCSMKLNVDTFWHCDISSAANPCVGIFTGSAWWPQQWRETHTPAWLPQTFHLDSNMGKTRDRCAASKCNTYVAIL